VVSASKDQTLRVWELATGRARATLEGHTNWVSACAVTLDLNQAIPGSDLLPEEVGTQIADAATRL
jgi:WD40 repeat protein